MAFLFVTIHEFGHCIIARCHGATIQEILFTPVGERAEIRGLEKLPYWKRQSIFLAGPFISLMLGLLFWFLFRNTYYANINFIIGGFNLLPFLPMDGGSFVLNFFGKRHGTLKTIRILKKLSVGFGYFLVGAGVVQVVLYPFNISLLVIGCYFVSMNKKGYVSFTYHTYQELLRPKKGLLPMKEIMVGENMVLGEIVARMNPDFYFVFCREKNGTLERKSQREVMKRLLKNGTSGKVWDEPVA